ncbi:thiamine pyrophosphate-dependent enzyme [Streptomyces sp. NPDC002851]
MAPQPQSSHQHRSAGHALVDALALHGVERVFAVPGESYLDVLDGLHDAKIATVVCRHEGGAAYMAEAHGKLTGEPGVAMVTRGPGAANALVAVHAAWQDATPMVLFVGLIPTAHRGREAFQEFSPEAWFGTQAKKVLTLETPHRAGEVVAEAFFAARSGRPGPVVVGLPEDMLLGPGPDEDTPPRPVSDGGVAGEELQALWAALTSAHRPLILAGGPRWTPAAAHRLTAFAERHRIPVAQDWRASDRVPSTSPVHIGQLGHGRHDSVARMLADADLLLCVGTVPGDVATDGYTLRQSPTATTFVASPDPDLRGHSGGLVRHLLAAPDAFTRALDALDAPEALVHADWSEWTASGRAAQEAFAAFPDGEQDLPRTAPRTVRMTRVVEELVSLLPGDAVHTYGAGNHCGWAQRYFPTPVFPSQLSMRNGSMGYSVPAAVAASLAAPERLAVAVAGDGEFLMNGQELATAVQYGAAPLVLVMDNGQYGTIRSHQEQHYPGRVSGTQLSNPDFAAFARSFGAYAETVTDDAYAPAAVRRALDAVLGADGPRRPALLHLVVDPRILVP